MTPVRPPRRVAPTGALDRIGDLLSAYATGRTDGPGVFRAMTARPSGPWATLMVSDAAGLELLSRLRAAREDHDRILAGWDDRACDRCTPTELCPLDRQRLYAWHDARDRHATALLTLPLTLRDPRPVETP